VFGSGAASRFEDLPLQRGRLLKSSPPRERSPWEELRKQELELRTPEAGELEQPCKGGFFGGSRTQAEQNRASVKQDDKEPGLPLPAT